MQCSRLKISLLCFEELSKYLKLFGHGIQIEDNQKAIAFSPITTAIPLKKFIVVAKSINDCRLLKFTKLKC